MTHTHEPMTGDDFKKWRESLDLSQRAAEEITGISRRALAGWERGEGSPPAWVGYVCAAVSAGLDPWHPESQTPKRRKAS